jgi:nicotinamidase-related amidase
MPEAAAETMINNCETLLECAQSLSIPVLATEQYPAGLGATCARLADRISDQSSSIFEKTAFSSCAAHGFMDALKATGKQQVILAGQETHVCIMQTALQLKTMDYEVFVIEDACCSRSPDHKFYALQRLSHAGVIISNYESVIFEWLADANHSEFKKLSTLIR